MVDVPVVPAAVFLTILIGYFVMTVWFAQAQNQSGARKADLGDELSKTPERKAG